MPVLSIIVPVYKVEKYLPQCIDSILAQTITDYELILVDDGSPDRCGEICDHYAARYSNIKVIHKQNGGHTAARKAGIQIAQGTYVALIDSDDYLEPDMFERMIVKAEAAQADIVVIGYTIENGNQTRFCVNAIDSGVYKGDRLKNLYANAIFDLEKRQTGIVGTLWCKLFRREMIYDAFLSQREELRLGEDMLFSYQMLKKANSIVIDNENHGYHYRVWGGSITNTFFDRYFADVGYLYDRLLELSGGTEKAKVALAHYFAYQYVDGVYRLLDRRNRKMTIREKRNYLRQVTDSAWMEECSGFIQLEQLEPSVHKAVRLLKEGHINRFMCNYVFSAIYGKLRSLLVTRR